VSSKKEKLQDDNTISEGLPLPTKNEGSVKKGTFIGHNGREIEYTEDENGQVTFIAIV
jgi:hypothetical protein